MPKCEVEILTPAWRDIDRISDFHLMKVGPQSAERITDQILDTIDLLAEHPTWGRSTRTLYWPGMSTGRSSVVTIAASTR